MRFAYGTQIGEGGGHMNSKFCRCSCRSFERSLRVGQAAAATVVQTGMAAGAFPGVAGQRSGAEATPCNTRPHDVVPRLALCARVACALAVLSLSV
jgi:hypothetical protein